MSYPLLVLISKGVIRSTGEVKALVSSDRCNALGRFAFFMVSVTKPACCSGASAETFPVTFTETRDTSSITWKSIISTLAATAEPADCDTRTEGAAASRAGILVDSTGCASLTTAVSFGDAGAIFFAATSSTTDPFKVMITPSSYFTAAASGKASFIPSKTIRSFSGYIPIRAEAIPAVFTGINLSVRPLLTSKRSTTYRSGLLRRMVLISAAPFSMANTMTLSCAVNDLSTRSTTGEA